MKRNHTIVALLLLCGLLCLTGCSAGGEAENTGTLSSAGCPYGISFETWEGKRETLSLSVFGGEWDTSHCQGIAVDDALEYMYFSFTTKLVKVRIATGEVVGTVSGWSGHLGDLTYYDGKIYGSLEYYYPIGSFYVAVFDGEKIVGETSHEACMCTMYLSEVNYDYTHQLGEEWSIEEDPNAEGHAYGCSGIDGISIGKIPGGDGEDIALMVCYGIYGNTFRSDNDYQVMLQYDLDSFLSFDSSGRTSIKRECGDILDQNHYHTKGPNLSAKYFIYTGNTTYGVQNLEYDTLSDTYIMAVYDGAKEAFPNYDVFYLDGKAKPVYQELNLGTRQELYRDLPNSSGEETMDHGYTLSLAQVGVQDMDSGIWGSNNTGADMDTGVDHLYGNYYYIAQTDTTSDDLETATARLFFYDRDNDQWIDCSSLKGRVIRMKYAS